jgi:hypothetical protein
MRVPFYTSHPLEGSTAVLQFCISAFLHFTDIEALGNLIYIRVVAQFQKVIGRFQDLDRHREPGLCQSYPSTAGRDFALQIQSLKHLPYPG